MPPRLDLTLAAAATLLTLAACETTRPPSPAAASAPAAGALVLGRTDHVVVVRVGPGETAADLARRFLNDPSQAWRVAVIEGGQLKSGAVAAISLDPTDAGLAPSAVYVPVLCYHRFTSGRSNSLMEVSAQSLEAQLKWLQDNDYVVVPLSSVVDFVEGKRQLPPRAVAISIDDGYRSALTVAAPILRRYKAPATLFVYTDFVGSGEGLSWADIAELQRDPLFDVQSHSKSHGDMAKHPPGETKAVYAKRLHQEVAGPLSTFGQHFRVTPDVFAYPFGSTDPSVEDEVRHDGYRSAITVARGGNAPWTPPYLLRRDMIYGTDSVAVFARRLEAAQHGAVGGPRESEQ